MHTETATRRAWIPAGRIRLSVQARWIWLAILVFIAMSVWWLLNDDRMPDWDSGAHELFAAVIHSELTTSGQLLRPFTDYNNGWPPLVHFVGGLTIFLTGVHPMALILSSNVVFVPLLAFGCFGVGRIAYGPRAGLLAAILALGSPMIVSMMHEYDLDPPQAALVAVSVWAVLASRRFERVGISALGGVLSGLAMLTKQTSVVFLAGFLAVSVLRAGPRRYRGLLAYAAGLGIIAGPWYLYHWHEITSSFNTIGGFNAVPFQAPPRYTVKNLAWYGWDLVNQEVLAPFALAFAIGLVLATWRLVRRRVTSASVEPELLAGVAVSYLGMTYLTHKDPRYTLPMLVYVAVFATGWIGALERPRLRTAFSGAVIALAAIYFVGLSTGTGGAVRIPLPRAGNNIIYTRQLTLYERAGWVRGGPVHDADVRGLLAALPSVGVKGIIPEPGTDPIDFNTWGLEIFSLDVGIGYNAPLPAREQAYLILLPPGRGGPRPCQTMNDGSRIFAVRMPARGLDGATLTDPKDPRRRYTLVCPGRAPILYPRG